MYKRQDYDETLISIPNSFLFQNYIVQIQKDPLTGLPYIFLYTALVKSFFLLTISIANHCIQKMNEINLPSNLKSINGEVYRMVNFTAWKDCAYWPWDKLKTIFLSCFPNCFFILSIIFYGMGSEGFFSKLLFLCVFILRLFLLFHKQTPLNHQISLNNQKHIKILSLSLIHI